MSLFQTLRHARAFALGMLAWFVLAMGLAVASPLVNPPATSVVCSASGSYVLADAGDDGAGAASHGLDCVLCLPWSAPGNTAWSAPGAIFASAAPGVFHAEHPVALRATALPPARAPPSL